MHLHCHLKECIEDYGPVYSFWLFSFERLNGILGSFHTNNHDVSLQIMRRFVSASNFNVHNWPSEYTDTFSPLLYDHEYNKGSLMPDSALDASTIKPMPPVYEATLLHYQKESLLPLISHIYGHDQYTLLTVYSKCKALIVNNLHLGSKSSRYTTSSHVMVMPPYSSTQNYKLALIHHFLKVDIIFRESPRSIWFVAVNYFFEHQCRVWFGLPVEVWSTVTSQDITYIPLTCIKSRVAYSKQDVNFGRVIGTEKVLIVSPLLDCF